VTSRVAPTGAASEWVRNRWKRVHRIARTRAHARRQGGVRKSSLTRPDDGGGSWDALHLVRR
jgi:hypothetical protein